jgi:hypothetical protein
VVLAAAVQLAARPRQRLSSLYEQLIEGTVRLARSDSWHEHLAARRLAQHDAAATEALRLRLDGPDPDDLYSDLSRRAASFGFRVTLTAADLYGGLGMYGPDRHQIWVRTGGSPAQRTKVLAHELAHGLLGHVGLSQEQKARGEIMAEAVAYMVAGACGLDTSAYSFGYIVLWAHGGKAARRHLREDAPHIAQATRQILGTMA